jgi:hypothetical protein
MGVVDYIKNKITGYETRRTDEVLEQSIQKTYNIENCLDKIIGELDSKSYEHEAVMVKAYSDNLVHKAQSYAIKLASNDMEKKCLMEQKNRVALSRTLLRDDVTKKNGYTKAKALLEALEKLEEGLIVQYVELNGLHNKMTIEDIKKAWADRGAI